MKPPTATPAAAARRFAARVAKATRGALVFSADVGRPHEATDWPGRTQAAFITPAGNPVQVLIEWRRGPAPEPLTGVEYQGVIWTTFHVDPTELDRLVDEARHCAGRSAPVLQHARMLVGKYREAFEQVASYVDTEVAYLKGRRQ